MGRRFFTYSRMELYEWVYDPINGPKLNLNLTPIQKIQTEVFAFAFKLSADSS